MSGSKNCPETPRQKMIGMMYLVLTAMLALNVSSDILNGFTLVDNSLHTSIESAEKRNSAMYDAFEFANQKNPAKVGEWLKKANDFKKEANELYDYIENFKVSVVKIADKDKADPKARKIEGRDNLDAAGIYAIKDGNGKILKSKIDEFSKKLNSFYEGNKDKQQLYAKIFSTERISYEKTWESSMFELMPVAAVVTMLTKYQNDIRAAESEMVQYLKSQTDAEDFKVNKIEAKLIPESKTVFLGDRYKATIVLAASDSTAKPEYYVNGSRVNDGKYEQTASGLGLKKISGEIRLDRKDGSAVKTYKFTDEYMVSQPSATISNSDLNVVYRGIVNNFSVSVPSVAPENIILTVAGGKSVQRGPGKYEITTMSEGEITISVAAKIDKAVKQMGSGKFRIKKLPKPTAYLTVGGNQKQGGSLSPDELRSASLIASYGPDELVKANFTVISFTMLADGFPVKNVEGNKLDAAFISRLTKGKTLILSNIVARGPDGYNQNLGVLIVRLG